MNAGCRHCECLTDIGTLFYARRHEILHSFMPRMTVIEAELPLTDSKWPQKTPLFGQTLQTILQLVRVRTIIFFLRLIKISI